MSDAGTGTGAYVHGAGAEEQARLARMNDLINEACAREVRVAPGERVLDVGSGLGQFTRLMGRRAAGTRAVGVERDERQRAKAVALAREAGEEHLVEFRAGDAFHLPLTDTERGSFDLAHTRFVLEHVPRPVDVVREMVSVVRPGGRIALIDDDHELLRLWPELPSFGPVWRAYCRTYTLLGNEPDIGRRLPELLALAGARPVRATMIYFGACAGDPVFGDYVANLAGVVRTAIPVMVRERLIGQGEIDAALRDLGAWSARPGATLWYAMLMAEGVRPGGA